METKNLQIQLMTQNQVNKEVVFNEAVNLIDHFINKAIKAFTVSLPLTPNEGDIYIIRNNEFEEKIYYFAAGAWGAIAPKENMLFFIIEEQAFFCFHENKWQKIGG